MGAWPGTGTVYVYSSPSLKVTSGHKSLVDVTENMSSPTRVVVILIPAGGSRADWVAAGISRALKYWVMFVCVMSLKLPSISGARLKHCVALSPEETSLEQKETPLLEKL